MACANPTSKRKIRQNLEELENTPLTFLFSGHKKLDFLCTFAKLP